MLLPWPVPVSYTHLVENYKFSTVNLRIRAINCYLESVGKSKWSLTSVKIQQKAYLENVISEADYDYFKACLKRDDEMFWYFVIHFLASTGARISELLKFKAEHVERGYIDIYSKGGKDVYKRQVLSLPNIFSLIIT